MVDVLNNFGKKLRELENALNNFEGKESSLGGSILDYKAGKAQYLKNLLERSVKGLKEESWNLCKLRAVDKENEYPILDILNLSLKLKPDLGMPELRKYSKEIEKLATNLRGGAPVEKKVLFADVPELPETITPDVMADLNEIRKCFDYSCYRSCVVLCGRILETALNRKYFEVSGNDLMETSPGLGLGKLVAKLSEMNIQIDPGLTQQIHLINQVRISSVHSKRDAFYPSKGQAEAMILYTMDVLRKLFA